MKFYFSIVLTFFLFSDFSYGIEIDTSSVPIKLELKSYKKNYTLDEPIIILFNISNNHPQKEPVTFCMEEKYYVFAIKLINSNGDIITKNVSGNYINRGMFINKKMKDYADSQKEFITVYHNKQLEIYLCLNEIWPKIEELKPDRYLLELRMNPYLDQFNNFGKIIKWNYAWIGQAISNTIEINLIYGG